MGGFTLIRLTLLLGAVVLVSGCELGQESLVHIDGTGVWSTVEVKRGTKVEVALDANPTTGYEWEVIEIDEQFLKLDSSTYKAANSGAIGGGGTETFRFSTLQPGLTALQLIYKRPSDPPSATDQIFRVTINITD